MSTTICLALGSNLGDRENNLQRAVQKLSSHMEIIAVSDWLQTAPVDCPPDAGMFLNGALLAKTQQPANDLLMQCLKIEAELGRTRNENAPANAPRVVDIDLLFYGQEIIDNPPRLIVPHPRLHLREFVLRPLAQIAGNLIHPEYNLSVNELLQRITEQK